MGKWVHCFCPEPYYYKCDKCLNLSCTFSKYSHLQSTCLLILHKYSFMVGNIPVNPIIWGIFKIKPSINFLKLDGTNSQWKVKAFLCSVLLLYMPVTSLVLKLFNTTSTCFLLSVPSPSTSCYILQSLCY